MGTHSSNCESDIIEVREYSLIFSHSFTINIINY